MKLLKNELGLGKKTDRSPEYHASIQEIQVVEDTRRKYESEEWNGLPKWLEKLSTRIWYYGQVLDTLAQHHPEYVALAWGSLKFVLIVSFISLEGLSRP